MKRQLYLCAAQSSILVNGCFSVFQFHKSCIDQWLLEKRTCPMCKMDILKFYGLVEETAPEEEAVLNLA